MFNIGIGEMIVLAVIALMVFGPERLPGAITEAARMLRQLRRMANEAKAEITSELGPEMGDLDLQSLNPKTFVRNNLLGDGKLLDLNLGLDDDEPVRREKSPDAPTYRPSATPALQAGESAPVDEDAT